MWMSLHKSISVHFQTVRAKKNPGQTSGALKTSHPINFVHSLGIHSKFVKIFSLFPSQRAPFPHGLSANIPSHEENGSKFNLTKLQNPVDPIFKKL